MTYKKIKPSYEINGDVLTIYTELGYELKYKIITTVDPFTKYNDGLPDFTVNTSFQEITKLQEPLPLNKIATKFKNQNLLEINFEYLHIGFIYSDQDPNNHRWMINAFNKNNQFLFNFIGDNVKVNCPFTTVSWQDGIWHGRFLIHKKDIISLKEPKQGHFVIKGKGKLKEKVEPIKENVDKLSLRYNIQQNMWYCDYKYKNEQIGSYPAQTIKCDVQFEGNIDRSHPKPKVTAELKAKDVKGISIDLNKLIIKGK